MFLFYWLFIILLSGKTTGTYSFIIQLHLIDGIAVYHHVLDGCWCRFVKEVDDTSALFTVEVDMRVGVTVVADPVLVYRYHACSIVFRQKPQRVVHCRTA